MLETFPHLHVRFERDGLVGVGHHGDEHVEEDDDVTHGVETEHEQGPETGEFLYSCSNFPVT